MKVDKEKIMAKAEALRARTDIHFNCAQSVLVPFAEAIGLTEEAAFAIAAHFGSGMRMGATCGAVAGGLMVLGAAGLDDPSVAAAFTKKIRENHGGLLDCRDLLRVNAEKGGEKKPHCDAMVYESVALVVDLLNA